MKLPDSLDAACAGAARHWGVHAQEASVIGEIGELLTLFGRRSQGRATEDQWVDEIADCIIMLSQLAHIHDVGAVEARIAEKVGRMLVITGAIAPPPRAPDAGTDRQATADQLLRDVLPWVQHANDCRAYPAQVRGQPLTRLHQYLQQHGI